VTADTDQQTRQYLLARFWEAALGFWRNGGGRTAWVLTFAVIAIAVVIPVESACRFRGSPFDSMMERGPKIRVDLACWTDEAL
jgi:hypothetical protein